MASTKDRVLKEIEVLVAEGQAVVATDWAQTHLGDLTIANPQHFVDVGLHAKWVAGCRNLMLMLGQHSEPWKAVFEEGGNRASYAKKKLGTLQGIKQAVERDLMITVEDLVMAEAFADLLEQADYLLSEGYFLAAGVLGRAVLEEHLRKWCGNAHLVPTKTRPTLNDFKLELQKASKLNKIEVTQRSAMKLLTTSRT